MSLLILVTSIGFIVDNQDGSGVAVVVQAEEYPSVIINYIHTAVWSASVSLSVTLASMTGIALLNRPLDPPKTLWINSRLLRLAPRMLGVVVLCCIPLIHGLKT